VVQTDARSVPIKSLLCKAESLLAESASGGQQLKGISLIEILAKSPDGKLYFSIGHDQEKGLGASGNGSWSNCLPLSGAFPKKKTSSANYV
jgi:hypothetical protein